MKKRNTVSPFHPREGAAVPCAGDAGYPADSQKRKKVMHMTCPHFKIRISSRGKKQNAVAQAAYQSGEKLFDERSRRTKNYSEKRGIIYTEIILPPHAPPAFSDRNTLWNSVEAAEPNWNSQLARRLEIALPIELSMEQRIVLLREYIMEQFVEKGMIADLAVHDPDPPGHNPHAHVMLTMRPMDEHGRWLPKSKKEYELDEDGNRIRDSNGKWKTYKVFTTDWDDHGNAEKWRHAWEVKQNEHLKRASRPERIDMRSYKRQGLDLIPTVHLGPAVTAMEARGIRTDIGDLNRDIRKHNRLLKSLTEKLKRLIRWIADVKEAIREIDMEPKEIPLYDLLVMKFDERKMERFYWESQYGRQKAGLSDLKRFVSITNYMAENDILTAQDLDRRMDQIQKETADIRKKLRQAKSRSSRIGTITKTMERFRELSPVHDAYLKIHWKKKQQDFYEAHREELEEWKKCSRYLHKNLPDMKYDADALEREQEVLQEKIRDLSARLLPFKEEASMISDIRYLIREYLPELKPEKGEMTPEEKSRKKTSMKETIARAKREADLYNASRRTSSPDVPRKHEPTR
ncbi:MAG: MobA/MobL family protein [Eubacterium sp.]|nr:MobA/MobL family protein [Eubacterium sp.]